MDPEATQVHRAAITVPVGDNSVAGVQPELARRQPGSVEAGQKPKTSPLLMVGAGVLILLLVGGVGGYFLLKNNPVSTPVVQTKDPTTPPTEGLKPSFAEIPGGTFLMGWDKGPLGEAPAHKVTIQSPFWMDRTEVTNNEYAEFVRETHHAPPDDWNGSKPPYGTEKWPVLNVSLQDVNAFASWRSQRDGVTYRLPTEEEWEYAARNGERNDLYPWGNDWKDNHAVLKEATPAKVGSHPEGNNQWGVQDLIGNVWEWTSSRVSAYPGNRTPIPSATKDWMVIRGAGYDRDPSDKDNPVTSCIRTFVSPESKIPQLGFRLVRSGQ